MKRIMSTNRVPLCFKSFIALGLVTCSILLGSHQASGAGLGSSLIRRQFVDIDAGQVYVYRGVGGLALAGRVLTWAFFDDRNAGRSVTPLLLKKTGTACFTVTGIGSTRESAGSGLQSFPFETIAGSEHLAPGYTFGFVNRAYSTNANQLVPGLPNTGVICFDRPSAAIPNDPWLVTAGISSGGAVALQIGTVIGSGSVPAYNSIDPGGLDRVYSAQVTMVPEKANGMGEAVQILYPRVSEGRFRFIVPTRPGQAYTLQQSTKLWDDGWSPYTNFLGDGSLMGFELPIANFPVQFFRVIGP